MLSVKLARPYQSLKCFNTGIECAVAKRLKKTFVSAFKQLPKPVSGYLFNSSRLRTCYQTFNHIIRAPHCQTSSYSTLKWLAMHSLCCWQFFSIRETFLHWTLLVRQHPVFSRNSNICYHLCYLQPVSVSDCVENVCSTHVARISVYLFFQHSSVCISFIFFLLGHHTMTRTN